MVVFVSLYFLNVGYRRFSINPGYVAWMPNGDNCFLSLLLVAEEYLVQRKHTAMWQWNAHNDAVLIPAIYQDVLFRKVLHFPL